MNHGRRSAASVFFNSLLSPYNPRDAPMVVGPNFDYLMPLKVLPGFLLCRLLIGRR
jgi:hypothetical protein